MNQKVDILYVEDDRSDAEMIMRILLKSNAKNTLLHLQNGEEALEYIFATGRYSDRIIGNLPKVILLDLKMPKINGLEVLERIKSDERTKTIPVVLLTSSKEDNDIACGYNLGVNSYIIKPVEFEELEKVISASGLFWLSINHPPK